MSHPQSSVTALAGSTVEDTTNVTMPKGHQCSDDGDKWTALNTHGPSVNELADTGHTRAVDGQAANVNPGA
jgi:hypothetical protein